MSDTPDIHLAEASKTPDKQILSIQERDFLVKTTGISPERLWDLEKNTELKGDTEHIMANLYNTTEINAFKEKYIPQDNKSVKVSLSVPRREDGTIDFEKWFVGKTPEQRAEMADGLGDRKDQKAYTRYIQKHIETEGKEFDATIIAKKTEGKELDATIIAEDTTNDGKKATIIKQEKECSGVIGNLEKLLTSSGKTEIASQIEAIKRDPNSPEYQELKGKGATDEQIMSGKLDNSLTGLYTINHASEFISNKWIQPDQQEAFSKVVDNFSDSLGRDRSLSKGVKEFIDKTLVSGERKELTTQAAIQLESSGKYNLSKTTYNAENGYITFYGENKGESTRIDTSKNPPKIEYGRSGLTISKNIEKTRPSPELEIRNNELKNIKKDFGEKKHITQSALFDGYQQLQDNNSPSAGVFLERFQKIELITNPQEKNIALESIKTEKNRIALLPVGNTESAELKDIQIKSKKIIINSLSVFEDDINTSFNRYTNLPTIPENQEDTYEKNAQSTLGVLIDLGYKELGQKNLESLMRGLRVRDGKKGIWSKPELNMTDTFIREKQLMALKQFSETSKGPVGLQNIAKKIQIDERFRHNWNNSESWITKPDTSPSTI